MGASAALCVILLSVFVLSQPAGAKPTSNEVVIQTLAGSGALGIADGLPGTFVFPFALTYSPDGLLYVTDAGAQRIRSVDRLGRVRTIAGGGSLTPGALWVAGGYRDGPGNLARFNRPAGIAWLEGSLYVADTNNHCIRKISANGTVSTFAGSATTEGVADGPVAQATFLRPTGLAKDRQGNLYVADFFGVRVIHNGVVTTLPQFGNTPFGVAVVDSDQGPTIFGADLYGLIRRSPDGTVQRFATVEHALQSTRNIQGGEPLGYPFSVAAFDRNSVIYGDVRGNSIRYLNWDAAAEQVLAGADVFDGDASSAGSQDGRGDSARFNGPTGLAIGPHGIVAIADGGSHRIRLLTQLDRTHDARPTSTEIPLTPPAKDSYRVAFIGNSFIWSYDRWSDSIPGIVERSISRDPGFKRLRKRLIVEPYVFQGAPIDAQADYINQVMAQSHAADLVVLTLTPSSLFGIAGIPSSGPAIKPMAASESVWAPMVTTFLRSTNANLMKSGMKLIVVTTPMAATLSPSEELWNQLLSADGQTTPFTQITEAMNQAVAASGVHYLNGAQVFASESRSMHHSELFGTQDEHFSPHGRAVIANALADYIGRMQPWQH